MDTQATTAVQETDNASLANPDASENVENQEQAQEKPFTSEDVVKKFFGSSDEDRTSASEYAEKCMGVFEEGNIYSNFDMSDEDAIPDGYDLFIGPLQKRVQVRDESGKLLDEKKTVAYGAIIAAIPSLDLVSNDERGTKLITSVVQENFASRVVQNVRNARDDGDPDSLPFSLDDFLVPGRRGDSLKTFTETAPAVVKALKKKGLKSLTTGMLKRILQSSYYAKDVLPNVEQKDWVGVIDLMITLAGQKELDPAILNKWKENRDTYRHEEEVNLADDAFESLADMVAS